MYQVTVRLNEGSQEVVFNTFEETFSFIETAMSWTGLDVSLSIKYIW